MSQNGIDSTGDPPDRHVTELVDVAGTRWRVEVELARPGGRLEATGLHVTSDGGALTTTTLRAAEREVMGTLGGRRGEFVKAAEAAALTSLDDDELDPELMPHPRNGPTRNHELWRRRAVAVARAWRDRRPLVDALRELEPGSSTATYRVRLARTRDWDRDSGAGILADVHPRGPRPERTSE